MEPEMNNSVCKKCGAVIYSNSTIDIDGLVYCTTDNCTSPSSEYITGGDMSWSDLAAKHDKYE
jgi:hypothetical protein